MTEAARRRLQNVCACVEQLNPGACRVAMRGETRGEYRHTIKVLAVQLAHNVITCIAQGVLQLGVEAGVPIIHARWCGDQGALRVQ